jgi:DNA-binding transcriptional ArsR family regulator
VETNQVNGFDALGDPTRRAIFERLATRPQPVGELAHGLPVSRPAVSQHLRVLKLAGLVTDVAQGTRRIYRIDPNGIGWLRDQLDRFWDQALAAFKAVAEDKGED